FLGNVIGASSGDGTDGNLDVGLILRDAPDNTVGGAGPSEGNVISGNALGLLIEGASAAGNLVVGNAIGMDRSGEAVEPNASVGLLIDGGRGITVGGLGVGGRNPLRGICARGVQRRALVTA